MRVEDGAEGFVYIHAGLQDRGSLSPEDHDWRKLVAKIVIRLPPSTFCYLDFAVLQVWLAPR